MVDVYNKTSIESLPLRLQEDEWKTISIPNQYYNTMGEILYGPSFSKRIIYLTQISNQFKGNCYPARFCFNATQAYSFLLIKTAGDKLSPKAAKTLMILIYKWAKT